MNITFFGHSFFSNKEDSEEKMIKLIENISGGKEINFLLGVKYGGAYNALKYCIRKRKKYTNIY